MWTIDDVLSIQVASTLPAYDLDPLGFRGGGGSINHVLWTIPEPEGEVGIAGPPPDRVG